MQWSVKYGNILDERADVLVCSANPYLTLSGGVGAAFLARYGDEMQLRLQNHLTAHEARYINQGDVVAMPPCGSPYLAVLHAVGVNAFYETSAEVITGVVQRSLEIAATYSAFRVALTAIATGYGRLSVSEFAVGIAPLFSDDFSPLNQVVICLRDEADVQKLCERLPELGR